MTATVSSINERPADVVFAYATDPSVPRVQQGVVTGHLDDPHAPRVGTICRTTRRIGGANRANTSVITHISPPRAGGVRGNDGPIRAVVDVTVDPLDQQRSRLTISVDFTGHGPGKVLVPLLVRPQARKEMPANLAAVKACLEQRS
jgi:hypothetical protein